MSTPTIPKNPWPAPMWLSVIAFWTIGYLVPVLWLWILTGLAAFFCMGMLMTHDWRWQRGQNRAETKRLREIEKLK